MFLFAADRVRDRYTRDGIGRKGVSRGGDHKVTRSLPMIRPLVCEIDFVGVRASSSLGS